MERVKTENKERGKIKKEAEGDRNQMREEREEEELRAKTDR